MIKYKKYCDSYAAIYSYNFITTNIHIKKNAVTSDELTENGCEFIFKANYNIIFRTLLFKLVTNGKMPEGGLS